MCKSNRRTLVGILLSGCAWVIGLSRNKAEAARPLICDKECPVKGCESSCFEEKGHKGAHLCLFKNHKF